MNDSIQVVTIGNAFELVYRDVDAYANMSKLAKVDECHFGQKAAFWATRFGQPTVAICTSAPSAYLLDAIFEDHPRPAYIEPRRTSSSISLDLLDDHAALSQLQAVLDRKRRVYLAPYVHTPQVERLCDFLVLKGYDLVEYRSQAELVKLLWSKVSAQQLVFQPVDRLCRHRPKSIVAHSESDLPGAVASFARLGIEKVVVKSSAAVGGAGIFFLNSGGVSPGSRVQELLVGHGQNEADRSPPFLIEERVQSDASPTVDIEVTQSGQVEVVGIALQRLYDGRYYTGFYSSPVFKRQWWFSEVCTLAKIVGYRLAKLGYFGPVNIDFVVSLGQRRIYLIEVNPRRSALIDGFSLRKMKYSGLPNASISVADYVNISGRFIRLQDALAGVVSEACAPSAVLPVADGGFTSRFRWAGVLAVGADSVDSEDVLEGAVRQLQDPERNEIGLTKQSHRLYERICEKVA